MSFAFYTFYLMRANFSTRYIGLTKSQFGDISALMAAVGFLAMTPWGKIADATGRHRFVTAFCTFMMASSFMLFVIKPSSDLAKFIYTAVVMSLYSLFSAGLQPLTDYHALKMLQDREGIDRDCYGRQRVWGTIAYGVISLLMGKLIKAYGPVALFYVVPSAATLFIVTIYLVTAPDNPKPLRSLWSRTPQVTIVEQANTSKDDLLHKKPEEEPVPNSHRPSRVSDISQLLKNPNYLFLLLFVFLSGSARSVMTSFAAMYWNEDMKLDTDAVGIAANFGILMEIMLFFIAPFLLHFFGIYWMLIFSQLSMALRCWFYVLLPSSPDKVYFVYAIELLKGTAFGFGQIAGVKICVDVAPPGLEATAQAIYTSFYSQLPSVLAAAIGGRLYQWYGAKTLFLVTAIISTAALGLFFFKYTFEGKLFRCCRRQSSSHA